MIRNYWMHFLKKDHYFNVCFIRIIFYLFLLSKIKGFINFSKYLNFPDEMMVPTGLLFNISMKNFIINHGEVLSIIFYLSILFSALGLFTRVSTKVAFLVAYLFFSIPRAYNANLYLFLPITSVMFFMCFARSGDFLSLDYFLFKRKNDISTIRKFEYGWAIKMTQFLFVYFFFSSGFLKLYKTGSSWFLTDTLRNYSLCSPFSRIDFAPKVISSLGLNYYFSQFSNIFKISAFVSILTELLAPLMLFSKLAKKILIPYFICFQIIALFLLYIDASINIPLYFFWVNWRSVYLSTKRAIRKLKIYLAQVEA